MATLTSRDTSRLMHDLEADFTCYSDLCIIRPGPKFGKNDGPNTSLWTDSIPSSSPRATIPTETITHIKQVNLEFVTDPFIKQFVIRNLYI